MTEYCLGFCFDSVDKYKALLIKKNRPEFMVGRLNGIGGRRELGESPLEAMKRETFEECGLKTTEWHHFLTYVINDCRIYCFCGFDDLKKARTKTDEEIVTVSIFRTINEMINRQEIVETCAWMIPMALNFLNQPEKNRKATTVTE